MRMSLYGKMTTAAPSVNMTSLLKEVSEQDSLIRLERLQKKMEDGVINTEGPLGQQEEGHFHRRAFQSQPTA